MKIREYKWHIYFGILLAMFCVINMFYETVKKSSVTNEHIGKILVCINVIRIVIFIAIIIGGIVFLVKYIGKEQKITKNNLQAYSGEAELKKIDVFVHGAFHKSNEYYLWAARIIDEVYEGNVVKNLVKTKNLEEFYRRKAFIDNKLQFNSVGVNLINTIIISLFSSFIWKIVTEQNFSIVTIIVIIPVAFISVMMLITAVLNTIYTNKGVDSGFKEELFTYEIKKIEEKIQEIQKNLVEENDVEKLKKVVLSSLTQLDVKGWKKKEKEILECDINDIYEIREESIVTTNKVAVQIEENSVSLYFDETKVKKAYKIYFNKCRTENKKAMKKSKFVKSIKEEWEVEKYLNDDSKKILDYMKRYNIAIKI